METEVVGEWPTHLIKITHVGSVTKMSYCAATLGTARTLQQHYVTNFSNTASYVTNFSNTASMGKTQFFLTAATI